jgi:NADH-quinone oxidoreductase subunit M
MALREDDLKRLVSQVDLSRLGLVLLAVSTANPVALNGGILLMFGAGMAIAVFLLVAGSLAERAGTDSIRALGGLAIRMPRGATLGILAVLAALGLPGLVTFTAQFMVLVGSYPSQRWATTIAVLGPLLLAGLMFSTLQRIFFGPIREGLARVRDLGSLELTTTISLVSLMVLLGIFPFLLTDNINFGILTLLVRASP